MATVEGVATLRAYGVQSAKRSAFVAALDAQTVTTFACVALAVRVLLAFSCAGLVCGGLPSRAVLAARPSPLTPPSHPLPFVSPVVLVRSMPLHLRPVWVVGVLSPASYRYTFTGRWFGFRLDFVSLLIVTVTALSTALAWGVISPAFAALSLTYAMRTGGVLQYMTRLISEGEANFTSVERLLEFGDTTPMEAPRANAGDDALVRAQWPTHGALAVREYRCRYRPELDDVLHGVSFSLRGGESLGIVGRTGSGKSTFILSLFRLIEASGGTIEIDGVDIATVGLDLLRRKLSVIPQNPVLFNGTIRSNLDPVGGLAGRQRRTDAQLWGALEKVQLKVSFFHSFIFRFTTMSLCENPAHNNN